MRLFYNTIPVLYDCKSASDFNFLEAHINYKYIQQFKYKQCSSHF